MRNFRRLPPLLRVMGRLGTLVGPVAIITLITATNLMSSRNFPLPWEDVSRISLIALDCGVLAINCAIVVMAYKTRYYQPERELHPLGTWQRQVRAWGILAAVPLCDIVLALVLSPDLSVYGLAFGIGILGAWIAFGGVCWMVLGARP